MGTLPLSDEEIRSSGHGEDSETGSEDVMKRPGAWRDHSARNAAQAQERGQEMLAELKRCGVLADAPAPTAETYEEVAREAVNVAWEHLAWRGHVPLERPLYYDSDDSEPQQDGWDDFPRHAQADTDTDGDGMPNESGWTDGEIHDDFSTGIHVSSLHG